MTEHEALHYHDCSISQNRSRLRIVFAASRTPILGTVMTAKRPLLMPQVENALKATPGVREAAVSLVTHKAEVSDQPPCITV